MTMTSVTTSTTTIEATRTTVEGYFERLRARADWAPLLADNMVFSSRTSPERTLRGREAYVQATKGFYGMIVEFESDVAETFTVTGGVIESLAIYFDTAPYPKRPSQ